MSKANIVVNGYGNVGKLVVELVDQDDSLQLKAVIDRSDSRADFKQISAASLKGASVIIDFSQGSSVLSLVNKVAEINPRVRIVTGTSGWSGHEQKVMRAVKKHKLYFLHGANFSIGTALFQRIVNHSAQLFNQFPGFDPSVFDIHHRHKRDMPSGTARQIAQDIIKRTDTKKRILVGTAQRALKPDQLHVSSLRVGENKGFHEVSFDAPEEVIKISQQTRDRATYARGSSQAAKWLMKKKRPGYYTFDQYIEDQVNT